MNVIRGCIFMHPLATVGGEGIVFPGCLSSLSVVRLLKTILRDAISLYLVEGFQ